MQTTVWGPYAQYKKKKNTDWLKCIQMLFFHHVIFSMAASQWGSYSLPGFSSRCLVVDRPGVLVWPASSYLLKTRKTSLTCHTTSLRVWRSTLWTTTARSTPLSFHKASSERVAGASRLNRPIGLSVTHCVKPITCYFVTEFSVYNVAMLFY